MADKLMGYAAVFNSPSLPLGDFRETIRPGAFSRDLEDGQEIYAFHHHDASQVLGRTGNGTLKLEEDHRGLKFELLLPATSLGKDTHALVRRQDIGGMSFAFGVRGADGERWSTGSDGTILRELLDLYLFEISTTAVPAYPDTSVQARMALQAPDSDYHSMISLHRRMGRDIKLVSAGQSPRKATSHSEVVARHRQLKPDNLTAAPRRSPRTKPQTVSGILRRHRKLAPA